MPDAEAPTPAFHVAAAEIFRSLRIELLPRRRRHIPPVLFLHRRDALTGELNVTSFPLSSLPRETWPRTIALRVTQAEAEWWAVSVELKLKVREEEQSEDGDDDIPNESSWLVVVVCSALERQVWWSPIQRDRAGNLIDLEPERPMPAGAVRDEVLEVLGDRFCPVDA